MVHHQVLGSLVAFVAGWRLLIEMGVLPPPGDALMKEWWVVPTLLFLTTYAATHDTMLSGGVTGTLLYLVHAKVV
jgi:hypothetical protein